MSEQTETGKKTRKPRSSSRYLVLQMPTDLPTYPTVKAALKQAGKDRLKGRVVVACIRWDRVCDVLELWGPTK